MDDRQLWLDRVAAIRQWGQGGARAPHKPLLMLYALGRFQRAETAPLLYRDAEADLDALLVDFGPPNPTTSSYPFRRLANDDRIWVIETPSGAIPSDRPRELRDAAATGRLHPDLAGALAADPALITLIVRQLLDTNWPASLHDEILAAVGMDLDGAERALVRQRLDARPTRRRDPKFRERVLLAYEYRCAVCRYDGTIDRAPVGIDAAHVRWWSADGPDDVANGLCLCGFHHLLLDRGVIGITDEHEVKVSKHFIGRGDAAHDLVTRWQGVDLLEPRAGEPPPADEHIDWHHAEVFRSPARAG